MTEPEVTVRSTEAGRVTEVVVPDETFGLRALIWAQIPGARITCGVGSIHIHQPNGPDVVALAGERLRIAAGRVETVQP